MNLSLYTRRLYHDVLSINNYNFPIRLSRFRCSSHKLFIEEGRHHNIACELRLRKYCTMKMNENEKTITLTRGYIECREKCSYSQKCQDTFVDARTVLNNNDKINK